MFSQFLRLSKSRTEIYPLIAAVSFAVGMGTYASVQNMFFNSDVHWNPKERSQPRELNLPTPSSDLKE